MENKKTSVSKKYEAPRPRGVAVGRQTLLFLSDSCNVGRLTVWSFKPQASNLQARTWCWILFRFKEHSQRIKSKWREQGNPNISRHASTFLTPLPAPSCSAQAPPPPAPPQAGPRGHSPLCSWPPLPRPSPRLALGVTHSLLLAPSPPPPPRGWPAGSLTLCSPCCRTMFSGFQIPMDDSVLMKVSGAEAEKAERE